MDVALILNSLGSRIILFCLRDAAKHLDTEFSKQMLAIADEEGNVEEIKAVRLMGIDLDVAEDEDEKKLKKYQEVHEQVLVLQKLLPILNEALRARLRIFRLIKRRG